ncbi:uncharacterized protein METZ01_LOCUS512726, partial [marine metagenome]
WVFLKGLETLSLRMREHCRNAQLVAEWLSQQADIKNIYFPGLPDHPQHELAKAQQSGFGGIVSFELEGGKSAAWRFIDGTKFFSITANLGDTKSTITHPASTTHSRLSDDERRAVGINDALIRLSIGLEDIEDIKKDLDKGLMACQSKN